MANTDEINNLKRDLKTDKVAARQKAFVKLSYFLTSQRKIVNNIFETNNDPELSYDSLFYYAHEGILLQGCKLGDSDINEGDNRIKQYSNALHDLIEASNDPKAPSSSVIRNVQLIQAVTDVLKHDTLRRHFGTTYLSLLNILLNSSSNLTLVQSDDWKNLLKLLFKLLRADNPKFRFQFVVECTQKVVTAGCDNSFLAFEITSLNILDHLKTLLRSRTSNNSDRERQELLVLTYLCCKDIVVEYRFEVARFLEEISDYIYKAFKNDLHDKYRPTLFKLIDLALVTHIPILSTDPNIKNKIEYIHDKRKWCGSIKVYEEMLLDELKLVRTVYRDKLPPKVSSIVGQFASRFCYYAYWNDDIWQDQAEESSENGDQQNPKRFKYSNKLQTIIERIKPLPDSPSNFNWKWLIVLCELIHNYPESLQNNDIASIISLLSECQPLIEFKEQIYAFTKCCSVLLRKDEEFKRSANSFVYSHCQSLWMKISDEAARCCSNSNKNLIESHKTIQLFIYYHKYSSSNFIENVIKIFTSNSTVKCDTTLNTLIILLKRFNLDSLSNGKELTKQILSFAFEKITLAVLKKVIAGNEKPSYQILSQLAILCCLLKTDVINYHKNIKIDESEFYNTIIDTEEMRLYKEHIENITNLMQLKSRDKLIIESGEFLKSSETAHIDSDLEIPDELKCMIDEEIFQELLNHTEIGEKNISDQSTVKEIKDYLKDLMSNNELMMNLLSVLLKLEATNKRKINSLFITKRIILNVQEIERIFTIISSKNYEFDVTDTSRLASLINIMLSNHYHAAVGKLVRSYDLKNCLKWIYKQVDREFLMEDESHNLKLNHNAFVNSKMEQKLRYFMVTTLCEYFNYDGINTENVVKWIDTIQFSMDSIIDLHTIFKVVEIFGRQRNVPEVAACWIWGAGIVYICKFHNDSIYVMNCLIDQFPNLKTFTEQHESLTKYYTTVYYSFSKLCTHDANSKRFFGPKIAAKYLKNFGNYHDAYFTLCYDQELVKRMYENIYKELLHSASFEVKMAAINCFSRILYSEYEKHHLIEQQKLMNFCRKGLYKDFANSYDYNLNETFDAYNDEDTNNVAVYVQLFTSLFCANFNYRRLNLFELAKIFLTLNLPEKEGIDIFKKIQNRLNCYSPKSIVNLSSIIDLISKWIELSMEMRKFPWYLIGSESYQDFINEHYNLILLAALRTKIDVVDDFLESIELPLNEAVLPVISSCFAYLIPWKAKCAIKYEDNSVGMSTKLSTGFSENELNELIQQNIPEILIKILENVIDNQKFLEISKYQMDFTATIESIKFNDFEKCMNYMKEVLRVSKNIGLMTYLCKHKLHFVEQIFMLQKKNIQGTELKEQKLISLLHYNILVKETFEYMNDKSVSNDMSIKEFLSREIANFLCYLIVSKDCGENMRIIAADSLLDYLKNILPTCCLQFKSQLHKIIPQLVSICKKSNIKSESQKLRDKCFEIMNFLVLNKTMFKEEIAKLDRFPPDGDFDELRQVQLNMKYHDGEFSLIEEIEHFLEINDRRIEGIRALYEHLSTKKSELIYLFEELKNVSNNKFNSTLHRLVRSLIVYIRGNDEDRAIESIKCLGEIGCHNISTIVFNVEDHQSDTTYISFSNILMCQRFICNKVLEQLESLLLHHNVKIFQVTSEACYYLLRSASSKDFIPSPILHPFMADCRSNENLFYLEPKNDKNLELHKFVVENNFLEYPKFLKGFCVNMTDYAGDKILVHLIQNQLEFAEMLFPLIFHLLLLYNNEVVNNEITKTIVYFFEQCFEKLNYSEQTNEGSIFINKKIIRKMLKLIETIRSYCQDNPKLKIASVEEFNYLHIAKAAKHCEASFTAIQYCEMWARKKLELNNIDFETSMSDKTLQDVMYRSYFDIGIKDASDIFLDPSSNRSEFLLNRGLYFQCQLEAPKDASYMDYMTLLNKVGLNQIAHGLNENLDTSRKAHQYDCLWKLGQWDTVVEIETEIKDDRGLIDFQQEFEKYHYLSLKYSNNTDEVGIRNALHKCRKMIMELITHQILECSNSLYKYLEMSHRLAQIEDFTEVLFRRSTNTHELLLKKWSIHDELPFDYEHSKQIFIQRNSIFSTANIKAGKRSWIPDAYQSNTLFTIKQAVLADQRNDAISLISQLRNAILSVPKKMEVLIEEAKLHIDSSVELAKNSLTQIMMNNQIKDGDLIIQSTAYRLYGEILANSFTEKLSDITSKYFDKSIKYLEKYATYHQKQYLLAKLDDEDEMSQFSQSLTREDSDSLVVAKIRQASCIYETIAKYNDREYEFKSSYLNSPDFLQKKNTYLKNKERLKVLQRTIKNADADSRKSFTILQRSTDLDRDQIENAEKEKKAAARSAIYYYVRSTIYSPEDNILNIFRIVALMLANCKSSTFIQTFLKDNLLKIPSYKFIIALPQIVVRLNDMPQDPLNCLLKSLLKRCAVDHPHHTLPLILALVNSYADSSNENHNQEPRVTGAIELWNSLKSNKKLKPIINQMEQMSTALIHLANLPLKTAFIPPDHKVLKLTKLMHVQCPTIEIPVVRNGDYQKCLISIEKWDQNVKNVGGINAPKRIDVLCSDGISRPQLLKGKDDMRQDAIMQQIFGVVNELLLLDNKMQKNHARIRTYKVVPFSRRSGILGWCENTIPIGNYLVGERGSDGKIIKKGAHETYRPQDWTPIECIKKITEISGIQDTDGKLAKFNEVCEHIKPVFHNFFYEKFKHPGEHFERRFAYTISVAVSSMIGYILGIGDRHVQNILIDLKTAELIHIDFGVAFEQGKILPHPELIPFRLTRDIIAPFGVNGVDGIFRKTCERMIEILRQNEKALTTILEVLLYDPMYMWSIGVEQARRSQLECDEIDNLGTEETIEHDLMASRALNCVKMKLKGMAENSSVRYPSIEGQVQYLIQAATNPSHLCRLFRGWQAYL